MFFVFSVICLNFILVNLFIGVLCYHFGAAQTSELKNILFLNREQQNWVELQKLILKVKLKKQNIAKNFQFKQPKRGFAQFFHNLIASKYFDIFIILCIILNSLTMAMNYEGSSKKYQEVLENLNYAFTTIFVVECFSKILVYGFKKYIKDGWNKLDFIIVFLSLFDLFFEFILGETSNRFLRTGPQIIRIFRVVRVGRILKLIKKLESLKIIIENLVSSLPNIMNVAILLVLFYYIYAILGVALFRDIKSGSFFDKYNNFFNFSNSFFTLLGVISGQTWTLIFFDTFRLPPDCIPNENCGTCNFIFNSMNKNKKGHPLYFL